MLKSLSAPHVSLEHTLASAPESSVTRAVLAAQVPRIRSSGNYSMHDVFRLKWQISDRGDPDTLTIARNAATVNMRQEALTEPLCRYAENNGTILFTSISAKSTQRVNKVDVYTGTP